MWSDPFRLHPRPFSRLRARLRARLRDWGVLPPAAPQSLVDVPDLAAAVTLVRRLARDDAAAEDLVLRVEWAFSLFPPHEHVMRRLSLLQQQTARTGGVEEFCVTVLYAVAMEAVVRNAGGGAQRPHPTRSRSAPPQRRVVSQKGCGEDTAPSLRSTLSMR